MLAHLAFLLLDADPVPLTRAHAHNDYAHRRPLEDALAEGFCSVEADVFLVDGELRVGHDRKDLRPGRTLESLYLDPLLSRVRTRKGRVYSQPAPFTLLVDVKADGELVYRVLRRRLIRYREMLTRLESGSIRPGAVTVVISGERPLMSLPEENSRLAFLDGRLNDPQWPNPAQVAPLVSESFESMFQWPVSAADRSKIKDLVSAAHGRGQRIRFWATPDSPEAWTEMYRDGVDLVNTDDLKGLGRFLRRRR